MTITLTSADTITADAIAGVARCADGNGTLTELFFSDLNVDIARAKAICSRCTLAASCLRDALDREEPWGVWGGQLLENGRIIGERRPRGRPAVIPRPITVIDEDRTIRTIANVSEQREFEVAIRVA